MVSPVNTAATQQVIANPFQDTNRQVKEQDDSKQTAKTQESRTSERDETKRSGTLQASSSSSSQTQQETGKDRGNLVDISV